MKEIHLPNTIWMTYKTKVLPKQAQECYNTWVNKNVDSKVILYDDDDIKNYILKYHTQTTYNLYKELKIGVMKADLWRYCILYTHGGVYSDIDSICVEPVVNWYKDQTFITKDILLIGLEDVDHRDYCQWTILSTKKHPAMKYVVNYITKKYIQNGIDYTYEDVVHATAGPTIFREAINSYLGYNNLIANDVYNRYINNKSFKKQIQNKGIYLLAGNVFRGVYSKNLYGSQNFTDGYIRWVPEVRKLIGDENCHPGGN